MPPKTLLLGSQCPRLPFSQGQRCRPPAYRRTWWSSTLVSGSKVWLRAEAAGPGPGVAARGQGPSCAPPHRRAPWRTAAYVIPQVVLAHYLHQRHRARLFQESLDLSISPPCCGIPTRFSALPAESVTLGALLHNRTLTRSSLLPPPLRDIRKFPRGKLRRLPLTGLLRSVRGLGESGQMGGAQSPFRPWNGRGHLLTPAPSIHCFPAPGRTRSAEFRQRGHQPGSVSCPPARKWLSWLPVLTVPLPVIPCWGAATQAAPLRHFQLH